MKIANKTIDEKSPVFIIAELSANHGHNFGVAVKTIKAMKKAGADAVKIQTYTADTITIDSDKKHFQINQGTVWDGTTLYKLYQKAFTPWDWQPKLKKIAEDLGLVFFSSPFDKTAVDFLQKMKVPAYKVASFEITDIPLIEYMASKKKPMIISTGVAELSDIKEAITACKRMGNDQIIILKCTSAYPASAEDMNLNTIPDIQKRFKVIAGLSDHTIGSTAAITACALGAKVIEKHFILDKKIGGPDVSFSMEPDDFKKMVEDIRYVEQALGKITYELTSKAKKNREFSRSLFVVEDIKASEKFTEENIRSIRPGFGLAPKLLPKILGKKAEVDLERGTPLNIKHISR